MNIQTLSATAAILISLATLPLAAQTPTPAEALRDTAAHDGRVFVAAHRADWKYSPENSLRGLQNAIFFGVDIIETDVRQTADGHFIMMHDATVDRMTNGSGTISEMTLAQIRGLRLKTNWGQSTTMGVPTLEEFIAEARGRACLYLDKAGIDLPGREAGSTVRALLNVLRQHDALQETIFVLDWPYEKARRVFGTALDSVIYCPVIDDRIPALADYVEEYLRELRPVAFQFRMATTESETYRLLLRVLASGSRAFVAATWPNHTAGHDDETSVFSRPSEGWGWLINKGFSVIETNFPRDLLQYLQSEHRHR
ncbi:MAG: glycerophosphodiester phosphodiesterase family protein [Bacteroidaceae bacterium]|nr:glycerophosphodiester phosphodiesterase family protein [Bacteroidaceae bacterium]